MSQVNRTRPRRKGRSCHLKSPGWNDDTRRSLEELIERGAGQNLPVVFDFDNTIVFGDIGEATLAVLVRDGLIHPDHLPATFSPPFRLPDKGRVTLRAGADVTEYYDAFLAPTAHGERDPTPLANGYAWAIEVMEGLRPLEVVEATRTACKFASPAGPGYIEVTPGRTRFPAPVFYPEMIELLAALLEHGFDVWIFSASNVWSVRCMVQEGLNPRLRKSGIRRGLRADHIIGISTLLTDRQGRLYKDALLVNENAPYAALDEKALRSFHLTSRLQFPVPTYSGKIACIFDALGTRPYLCAGDSPGDHAMLAFSRHRLWIARLEKPGYQRQTAALIRKTGRDGWLIQPTLAKGHPGFLSDLDALGNRLGSVPREVRKTASILATLG